MSANEASDGASIAREASDTETTGSSCGLLCIKFKPWKFKKTKRASTGDTSALTQPHPEKAQCKICDMILETFRIGGPSYLNLGSLDDFLSSECPIHPRLVVSHIVQDNGEPSAINETVTFRGDGYTIVLGYEPLSHEYIRSGKLHLVTRDPSRDYTCSGRIVDPELIDTMILQKWKSKCDQEHSGRCRNSHLAASLPLPALSYLVDVSRKCLVPAVPGMSYIALSYVWGEVPMFKTSRADLERLQKDDALSSDENWPPIPRTILDAMAVVELTGERYLWVDSLCITQDDFEARHVQIRGMASIYAHASLTIIAEQGEDANFGLKGIPGRREPRLPLPERFELKSGYEVYTTTVDNERYLSSWNRRGWTFQEYLFSERRLIFAQNRVKWECYCAKWYDDITEVAETQMSSGMDRNDSFDRFRNFQAQEIFGLQYPQVYGYSALVRQYNRRALSYPEDALAAFSGIIAALSGSYVGGFLSGLPVLIFDVALIWHGSETLERRVTRNMSSVGDCIPSWSWAGWRGELNSWSWWECMDYLKHDKLPGTNSRTPRRLISLFQWFSGNNVSASAKLIQPSWRKYRSLLIAGNEEIPPGWTRYEYRPGDGHACEPDSYPEPGVAPSFFYKHESDSTAEFWYPIPLAQGQETLELNPATPLISCRTLRTWLYLDQENIYIREPYVTIRDKENRWAGVLFLPQPLSTTVELENSKSKPCELVMLSRGYIPVKYDSVEGSHEEYRTLIGQSEVYEYYNVLWIEWQDDIAYRKAVGRIERKTWECEATEWIDLTLG